MNKFYFFMRKSYVKREKKQNIYAEKEMGISKIFF